MRALHGDALGGLYVCVDTPFSAVNESVLQKLQTWSRRNDCRSWRAARVWVALQTTTEVREVSSRPSTPGLSVVSGTHTQKPNCLNAQSLSVWNRRIVQKWTCRIQQSKGFNILHVTFECYSSASLSSLFSDSSSLTCWWRRIAM